MKKINLWEVCVSFHIDFQDAIVWIFSSVFEVDTISHVSVCMFFKNSNKNILSSCLTKNIKFVMEESTKFLGKKL